MRLRRGEVADLMLQGKLRCHTEILIDGISSGVNHHHGKVFTFPLKLQHRATYSLLDRRIVRVKTDYSIILRKEELESKLQRPEFQRGLFKRRAIVDRHGWHIELLLDDGNRCQLEAFRISDAQVDLCKNVLMEAKHLTTNQQKREFRKRVKVYLRKTHFTTQE